MSRSLEAIEDNPMLGAYKQAGPRGLHSQTPAVALIQEQMVVPWAWWHLVGPVERGQHYAALPLRTSTFLPWR